MITTQTPSGLAPGAPLAAPTAVVASTDNASKIVIGWAAVAGAISYSVLRGTNISGAGATVLASGLAGTSYDDTTAAPETIYHYFVKVVLAAGTSGLSGVATGWRIGGPPAAFASGTVASDALAGYIHISWGAAAGALGYDIYRAGVLINSVPSSQLYYDDEAVDVEVTYTYEVKAWNYNGVISGGTNSGTAASPVPEAPAGLSATDTQSEAIGVTASPSAGATSYSVWRATTNNSAAATLLASGLGSPAYDDTTATPGTTYWYWMKAHNAYGQSGFSNGDSGYRPYAPPAPPAWVDASDGTAGDAILVTWAAVDGATGYEVWRGSTSNIASASLLASLGAVTSYTDESPTDTSVWYFWVRATGPGGTSGFAPVGTSEYGYAVVPAQAAAPNTTVDSVHYVRLGWLAATYAKHYSVWRNTVNSFSGATEIESNNTSLAFDDTTAPFDQALYYFIVAHNDIGAGAPSLSSYGYSPGILPDVPNLYNLGIGSGQIFLQWYAANNATDYDAAVGGDADLNANAYSSHENIGNITSYWWNPAGLSADGYYPQYYAIRGRNRFGVSAWSTTQGPIYQG